MIKKHSAIWFYVFTLIFTIILGGISQTLCVNFIPEQYQTIVSLVLVQMAPTLGTLFVFLWAKDKDCFKNMNWCPIKNITSILWLLLSFIIPAAIVAITSVIMSVYGKPYIPNSYPRKLLIMTVFGALIGCVGEEIG